MTASTKLKLLVPLIYLIASSVFFIVVLNRTSVETHHVIGVLLTLTSFGFWIISRIQLGNAFSIAPKSRYLVTSGIYGKLRHPVYYFSITALIGISIFVWNWIFVIPVLTLVIVEILRIRSEEKLLTLRFGNEYSNYKKSTWF